jgi:hypothetical protein
LQETLVAEAESSLLTPREWCERVLAALRQRKRAGPGVAYMEMMLTYLIELDPPHEEFGELLARYIGDVGPGIAGAADLLQASWRRAEALPAPPPLAETLRTLGGLLDDAGTALARLSLAPESVLLQALGPVQERALGPAELQQEIAARTALRGQVPSDPAAAPTAVGSPDAPARPDRSEPPDTPVPADRYEPLLRNLGAALAAEPPQSYEVYVTPRAVVVEGSAGYFAVFTRPQLAALRQEPPAGGGKSCWA